MRLSPSAELEAEAMNDTLPDGSLLPSDMNNSLTEGFPDSGTASEQLPAASLLTMGGRRSGKDTSIAPLNDIRYEDDISFIATIGTYVNMIFQHLRQSAARDKRIRSLAEPLLADVAGNIEAVSREVYVLVKVKIMQGTLGRQTREEAALETAKTIVRDRIADYHSEKRSEQSEPEESLQTA